MSSEEILTGVRRIIGEMCPLGARDVAPADRIMEDLGYDSMAVVELALVLEAEFALEPIDEEQAIDLVTVEDVAELVGRMVSARA
ncbi:phosphopantetheine-binding protein [Actinocorallia sp. API 0066]|uniref:acyl carrier protein n=1 Tax=Actinocorallia sp. API 0066 TaxID=2896846 RepID=UPI001E51FE02|nr:phosphopantetheine-binding protein [Actinocorallia sp. API 0066]MCD0453480.1 phosphopantetheine-binding protein [Actinocorallia sp. API 0066]